MSEAEVLTEVRAAYGEREVSDECARELASWYQSPGSVGHVLAALASGADWDLDAVLDDIAATRRDCPRDYYGDSPRSVWLQLDVLATWAIASKREVLS